MKINFHRSLRKNMHFTETLSKLKMILEPKFWKKILKLRRWNKQTFENWLIFFEIKFFRFLFLQKKKSKFQWLKPIKEKSFPFVDLYMIKKKPFSKAVNLNELFHSLILKDSDFIWTITIINLKSKFVKLNFICSLFEQSKGVCEN